MSPGPRARLALLLRKPLEESTIADQVASTGTGVLNIDGCRVSYRSESDKTPVVGQGNGGLNLGAGANMPTHKDNWGEWYVNDTGRWPPNVVLIHAHGCRLEGTKRVRGSGICTDKFYVDKDTRLTYAKFRGHKPVGFVAEDSLETAPSWICAPGCLVPLLDRQSGDVGGAPGDRKCAPSDGFGTAFKIHSRTTYGYSEARGGASRFFPQFTSEDEMIAWFDKLGCKPFP